MVYVPSFVPLTVSIFITDSGIKCFSENMPALSLMVAGFAPDAAVKEIVLAVYNRSS